MISYLAEAEFADMIRIQAENDAVNSFEACLKAKNFDKMSNNASTPVGCNLWIKRRHILMPRP